MSIRDWVRSVVRSTLRLVDLDVVHRHNTLEGHLARLLADLGVECVLDVGGHYGEYARLLRTIGYQGRIVSFEPIRANYDRMVTAMRFDGCWTGLPIALGDEPGELPINVTVASDLSSFLAPSAASRALGFPSRVLRTEMVKVERLDDMLPRLGLETGRLYLKLDTQGFDGAVLRGATRALELVVGLQTEVAVTPLYDGMTLFPASIQPLLDLGYELSDMHAVARKDRCSAIEFDCLLRRAKPTA